LSYPPDKQTDKQTNRQTDHDEHSTHAADRFGVGVIANSFNRTDEIMSEFQFVIVTVDSLFVSRDEDGASSNTDDAWRLLSTKLLGEVEVTEFELLSVIFTNYCLLV